MRKVKGQAAAKSAITHPTPYIFWMTEHFLKSPSQRIAAARLLKSSNRYEDVEKRRCGVAETRHTSSDFFEFRYLVYQQQINRYNNFTAVESAWVNDCSLRK